MTEPTRSLSAETVDKLLLDSDPYLSCDECFAQVDAYVERRIDEPDYVDPAMEAHLAGCGACAEEAEALRELLEQDLS